VRHAAGTAGEYFLHHRYAAGKRVAFSRNPRYRFFDSGENRAVANISTKVALLQALIRRPSYGLELIEHVREMTDGALELKQATLYPALHDLEENGFVESYDDRSGAESRGGRPRRYYRLTAEGARAAMEDRRIAASLFGMVPREA
jgi:PadR family transcriptional regulator PadR